MKFVISKDGVKRELKTPFALCCDMQDLDRLIRDLQAIQAGQVAIGTTYGWIRVDPSHPCDGPPNTPPRQWAD